nr:hypothetical protein CFP56_01212 [Quercus suber]
MPNVCDRSFSQLSPTNNVEYIPGPVPFLSTTCQYLVPTCTSIPATMTKSGGQKRAKAVLAAFALAYGHDEDRLNGWTDLCNDVGVDAGASITKCKKACVTDDQNLQAVHVNIVDFVTARRDGVLPHHFKSKKGLREYTRNTPGKVFPLREAKENGFLKALLVDVF